MKIVASANIKTFMVLNKTDLGVKHLNAYIPFIGRPPPSVLTSLKTSDVRIQITGHFGGQYFGPQGQSG